MDDFPYLYRRSRAEAERFGEAQRHENSFRLNVSCARAIEQTVREHFNDVDESLKEGCAQSVLEQYGFLRVKFVLANSLKESGCKYLYSDDTRQWGERTYVPRDGKYNRYFTVDTGAALLESFVGQFRQAYQELGLFGPEHCIGERHGQDYTGKVLVLAPDVLRESCWSPQSGENRAPFSTGAKAERELERLHGRTPAAAAHPDHRQGGGDRCGAVLLR